MQVNCGNSGCSNSIILCPMGGCNITCSGSDACAHAVITYYNETYFGPDFKGTVSVTCSGDEACYNTEIDANRAGMTCLYP